VSTKLKAKVELIIEVSRQLLSQLELQKINTITSDKENVLIDNLPINVGDKNYSGEQLTNDALVSLTSKRQSLLSQLFETYTQAELAVELASINEIVLLDSQLIALSQNNKLALTQQIVKLKKSSKVRDLYNKY
jgi:hypothetical protein